MSAIKPSRKIVDDGSVSIHSYSQPCFSFYFSIHWLEDSFLCKSAIEHVFRYKALNQDP